MTDKTLEQDSENEANKACIGMGDGVSYCPDCNAIVVDDDKYAEYAIDRLFADFKVHHKGLDVCFNDAVAVFDIKQQLLTLIKDIDRQARIDELNQLQKLHTRDIRQIVTGNNGDVYSDDTHTYISKYEVQERIKELDNLNKTKEDK